MITYLFRVLCGAEAIFQYEIVIEPWRSFRRDCAYVLAAFQAASPDVALHDPGAIVDLNPKTDG